MWVWEWAAGHLVAWLVCGALLGSEGSAKPSLSAATVLAGGRPSCPCARLLAI